MFILEDIFFNLAIDNYGLNYGFQAILCYIIYAFLSLFIYFEEISKNIIFLILVGNFFISFNQLRGKCVFFLFFNFFISITTSFFS